MLPRSSPPAASRLFLGLLDRHAVEEARIDHAAVAVIGGVRDDESFGSWPGGQTTGVLPSPYLLTKVEVALVVRGAAEDRAGAIFHQHEIGDVDRQLPVRIERMDRADAGVEAELLGGIDDFLRGADAAASAMNSASFGILAPRRPAPADDRRDRHELGAEQRVGPRREDLQLGLAVRAGVVAGSSAKRTSRPSERPIQLRCISRTLSGQRSSVSSASSSSCE
jgi:hypothetical protein